MGELTIHTQRLKHGTEKLIHPPARRVFVVCILALVALLIAAFPRHLFAPGFVEEWGFPYVYRRVLECDKPVGTTCVGETHRPLLLGADFAINFGGILSMTGLLLRFSRRHRL